MKIFLDDFTVYNDMDNHLMKFIFCFQKCRKYRINFNPDKCAFMIFLGRILGFILSKERKIPNLKKVQATMNVLVPKNPQHIRVFNGMAQFYRCFIKNFALSWH
jgi:hypothetical protein